MTFARSEASQPVAQPVASVPPIDDEIREQLVRIRSSPAFDAPERARTFLSYVIEETLHGRADRIKAYSVAIEVFGRDASFDAQNDPVVRIEAGRVRRALEHYYLLAGQQDPILITIPKGGYVPTFTRFHELKPSSTEPDHLPVSPPKFSLDKAILCSVAALLFGIVTLAFFGSTTLQRFSERTSHVADNPTQETPTIVVAPVEDITGTPNSAILARGLTDEVIGQMARFKEIAVLAGDPSDGAVGAPSASDLPLYRLEGRVRLDDDRLRLSTRLVDRSNGMIVWTKAYDADLGRRERLDVETEIASEIATALAQPYGVIFQTNASQYAKSATKNAQAYACTLSYYSYRADLNPNTHAAVQLCLKEVVRQFPSSATGWALLSLTYLDQLRFRYLLKPLGPPPLGLAIEAARKAVELDSDNVRALQAQMLAYFFSGDPKSALAVGERAFELNPNDTELAGEYGFRLALSGEWDRGCALILDAIHKNPGPMDYFQSAMAVCAYMGRDYAGAERWARTSNLHDNPIYHLILIAIYGQRGHLLEAQLERGWLEIHAPELLAETGKEVATRISRVVDQDHFIEGLRKAGLNVSVQSTPRSEVPPIEMHRSRG